MRNTSALNPVQAGLVGLMRGDAILQALLHLRPAGQVAKPSGRVFDEGTVPEGLKGRWVVIGSPTEGWARSFMAPGSALVIMLHTWHEPVPGDDVGKSVSNELWARLAYLLSGPVPVAGHTYLAGTATLIEVVKDPDGVTWHGIVRYEAITRVGP